MNKINVVSVTSKPSDAPGNASPKQLAKAKFDRLWHIDPNHFNPERNCLERERLERTLKLLPRSADLLKVADLGCGLAYFSKKLRDAGAAVDAIDIAQHPLDNLAREKNIRPILDYIPRTTLAEEAYDLVLCTELIAYLPENEFRLLFSELARIIKPTGTLVFSTPLDYRSEDALQRLAALAETEFTIEEWKISYHLFYLRLRNFLEAPGRFVRAKKDPEYRQRELERRNGFCQSWFRLNSHPMPALFWTAVEWISSPLAAWVRQSKSLMISLEKFCRFIWSDSGITHAIFTAKRRSLEKIPEAERPIERKQKKQVWE